MCKCEGGLAVRRSVGSGGSSAFLLGEGALLSELFLSGDGVASPPAQTWSLGNGQSLHSNMTGPLRVRL
jgi:hypothetical protein